MSRGLGDVYKRQPLIQGGVADFAGYLSSYWVVVAGLAYMLFYALVGSKNVNKDIPVEE